MKLSVIIPTYNRPQFLTKCVQNIAKNSMSPYEIIVVDDYSECEQEYRKVVSSLRVDFPNLSYLRLDQNDGAPKARNIGAARANGEYLLFCDDDDYWYPNHLSEIHKVLHANPTAHFIYSGVNIIQNDIVVDTTSYFVDPSIAPKCILKNCFISSPSVCINREKFLKLGGFDENFFSCQDWDMWTRIILDDPKIQFTGLITAAHVVHGGSRIGYSKNAWKGYLQYYKKHFFSFFKHRKILLIYHIYYILHHLKRRFFNIKLWY